MTKGLLLTLLAGVMNGSFPLPMRYMRKWAWENTWAVWSVVALLGVPWALALLTVPRLAEVYAGAGSRALLQAAFFGALWGIAGFLFGLSVEMVGMSLTFAVVNGLSSAIGSWVPMLILHPGKILTAGGLILSAGVLGVVGGVILCSWAGNLRSTASREGKMQCEQVRDRVAFRRGLIVVFSCGILAPAFNLGFSFGQGIAAEAVKLGGSPAGSTNAILAVVLTGGFVMNIGYCLYRLTENRTFQRYAIPETGRYLLLGSLMGLLWIVSYSIYGSATTYMGNFGTVAGWPILMAIMTIASGLWDAAYGDWKGRALRMMALGVLVLIGAVSVVSYGMYRLQQGL
jgi:L-rhamnose-H+ transport protein